MKRKSMKKLRELRESLRKLILEWKKWFAYIHFLFETSVYAGGFYSE